MNPLRKKENSIFAHLLKEFLNLQKNFSLCVTGARGCGKTHLLNSFGKQAEKRIPIFHASIQKGESVADVIQKIKKAPLIILDNFHLSRNPRELFHYLNYHFPNSSLVVSATHLNIKDFLRLPLFPFNEQEFQFFLNSKNIRIAPGCFAEIFRATYGNPLLLTEVLDFMKSKFPEEKILTRAHWEKSLPSLKVYLSFKIFDSLYAEMAEMERRFLFSAQGVFTLKEICQKLKKPENVVSSLALRLLGKGLLIKLERGKYVVFSGLFQDFIKSRFSNPPEKFQ